MACLVDQASLKSITKNGFITLNYINTFLYKIIMETPLEPFWNIFKMST